MILMPMIQCSRGGNWSWDAPFIAVNMIYLILVEKSLEEWQTMISDSTDGENKAFEIVKAAADQWEKQAAVTQRLYRAMGYVRMSPVHSIPEINGSRAKMAHARLATWFIK